MRTSDRLAFAEKASPQAVNLPLYLWQKTSCEKKRFAAPGAVSISLGVSKAYNGVPLPLRRFGLSESTIASHINGALSSFRRGKSNAFIGLWDKLPLGRKGGRLRTAVARRT
jgi:hypothetical protein